MQLIDHDNIQKLLLVVNQDVDEVIDALDYALSKSGIPFEVAKKWTDSSTSNDTWFENHILIRPDEILIGGTFYCNGYNSKEDGIKALEKMFLNPPNNFEILADEQSQKHMQTFYEPIEPLFERDFGSSYEMFIQIGAGVNMKDVVKIIV